MPRKQGTGRQYIDLGLPGLCRRLDAARRRKDWTQRDLARAAGIDDHAAANLIDPRNFGEPRLPTMVAVCRALGLTLDGLFGLPATSARIPPGAEPVGWI